MKALCGLPWPRRNPGHTHACPGTRCKAQATSHSHTLSSRSQSALPCSLPRHQGWELSSGHAAMHVAPRRSHFFTFTLQPQGSTGLGP